MLWGNETIFLLPRASGTLMVQSQAISDSEKTGLCSRGKRLFKPLLISIKERSFDLWNSQKGSLIFVGLFILDSCKFLFCRFTSLGNSIFNWTVTFIYWNAILNSCSSGQCHPGCIGYFKNHKRADWARSRQRWQSWIQCFFWNESWSEILTLDQKHFFECQR